MSNRVFMSRAFLVTLIALLTQVGVGCTRPSTQTPSAPTWRIGEVSALTGSLAAFGQANRRGMALALEQINEGGGVAGRPLEVVTLDDQSKEDEAVAAAQKLVSQEGVLAVVGEVASSLTLAMAPVAQRAQVPLLTPSSTNPRITQTGDFVFRACFDDRFQGEALARFARESLKVSRVALLKDIKNDQSVSLSAAFVAKFEALGGKITSTQSYSRDDLDFGAQLAALKQSQPEAVFAPGYYNEIGLIARQARKLGLAQPLFGGDGWDSPKLLEIGGAALDGYAYATGFTAQDPRPIVGSFVSRYRAKYQSEPDAIAAAAYDALLLIADALKRASAQTPRGLRDALAQTRGFEGVTGVISFDAERQTQKTVSVVGITGGKLHLLWPQPKTR